MEGLGSEVNARRSITGYRGGLFSSRTILQPTAASVQDLKKGPVPRRRGGKCGDSFETVRREDVEPVKDRLSVSDFPLPPSCFAPKMNVQRRQCCRS